jgi:hypothetical protein
VWGITLDRQCRVSITWPARGSTGSGGTKQPNATIPNADNGTFVTTQTGGDDLCAKKDALPGGSLALPWQALG